MLFITSRIVNEIATIKKESKATNKSGCISNNSQNRKKIQIMFKIEETAILKIFFDVKNEVKRARGVFKT
jgi:hypothetical protein